MSRRRLGIESHADQSLSPPRRTAPELRGLRAADFDRSQTADLLRQATIEGRLDTDELDRRLEQTWKARTFGELDAVVADLPVAAARSPTDVGRRFRVPGVLARAAGAGAALAAVATALALALALALGHALELRTVSVHPQVVHIPVAHLPFGTGPPVHGRVGGAPLANANLQKGGG